MVFTKTEKVQKANISPLVMQCYISLAIFCVNFLALAKTKFVFSPYALLFAALWVPGNFAAVAAVRHLGVGLAQGSWGGLITIISFVWGVAGTSLWDAPTCHLKNTPLTIVGLLLVRCRCAAVPLCRCAAVPLCRCVARWL